MYDTAAPRLARCRGDGAHERACGGTDRRMSADLTRDYLLRIIPHLQLLFKQRRCSRAGAQMFNDISRTQLQKPFESPKSWLQLTSNHVHLRS